MIVALRELGEVDVVCFAPAADRDGAAPPDIGLLRVDTALRSKVDRVREWLRGGLPRNVLTFDESIVRDATATWTAGRTYDLVVFSHAHSWVVLRDLVDAPTIVDLNDLSHLVIRADRRNRPTGAALAAQLKWLALQPFNVVDERRAERLELRCAGAVDAVTLCSQIDVDRLGATNAFVIANGYERNRGVPDARDGATVLFVGALRYPPNADAVRWFVHSVFPTIRARRPDVRLRIVGGGEAALEDLASVPGIELVGWVEDLAPELDAATISVVPIRFGSGTRLKVLEAMANRLPQVSTTLGAEGIDVIDGRDILLADDPDSFALACLRLLDEPELRSVVADGGEALWVERYQWSAIRADLRELATMVAHTPEAESRTTAGE